MDFSQALLEIKAGKKVSRENGDLKKNNLFIRLNTNTTSGANLVVVCDMSSGELTANAIQALSGLPTIIPNTSTATCNDTSSFMATSAGLLADDWYIVE